MKRYCFLLFNQFIFIGQQALLSSFSCFKTDEYSAEKVNYPCIFVPSAQKVDLFYSITDQFYSITDQFYSVTDQFYSVTDQFYSVTDQFYSITDQFYSITDQFYSITDQFYSMNVH